MFHKTRLKLTAWYLLIIMLISALFSMVIYIGIDNELSRIQHMQEEREQFLRNFDAFVFPPRDTQPDPEMEIETIKEARQRLILTLIGINATILVLSGAAGYFLAGRTLAPIQTMLDEQNRFITDASHELKTPLTALRSEIEVFMLSKKHTIAEAEDILKSNLEEVISLQELSEHLMTLTKYQHSDTRAVFFNSVDLAEIIDNALKKVLPLARKNHITIENSIVSTLLEGEQQSLTNLFVILIDNAIKYSREKTTITLSQTKHDNFVAVHITDQGIGIDEKDIPHLFDRFYRADQSRSKAEISGYGLGLSIAKQIVQMHQGNITIKSTIQKGTTVTVQLPLRRQKK